ncbi:MAG: VWA domain-containing protein, partial [Anaerolineae bacterium]|nr:VWA domain-containing protein [Anaerolineae bacterium]
AGLRWSAAQLFVDLAAPGDRIAAFAFATGVDPIGRAAQGVLEAMDDANSRKDLKGKLEPRAPKGATNMEGALAAAMALLAGDRSANRQVIVFLTDGEPDPPSQRPALEEAIRDAGRRGILVFPILLGSDTDRAIAGLMVHETGSMCQEVTGADGLLRAFGRVFAMVQPERYVDELQVAPGSTVSFQTNPDQAITDAFVIVPRASGAQTAMRGLTLEDEDVLGRRSLSSGAKVTPSEAEHYELVHVSHNAPLVGEWKLALGESRGTGLVIVQSHVAFDLVYPRPSVLDSFVSPRVVPVGKPLLILTRLKRAGSSVAGAVVSVAVENQVIRLDSAGPSANRDIYWKQVVLTHATPGQPQTLEIQAGGELAPLQLRKVFSVEPANVPPLIVDSPSAADSGLLPGGKLRLAAHFDGSVADARVRAYVWDSSGHTAEAELSCQGGRCQDESLSVEPGRAYEVLFVGTATTGGRPYTDATLARFVSGDVILVDGLDALGSLGTLVPGSADPAVPVTITALTQGGMPDLSASLERLLPVADGGQVTVLLSPPRPAGANTYVAQLTLRGVTALPPADYSAELVLQSPTAAASPGRSPVAFRIPQPVLRLAAVGPPRRPSCCAWERASRPADLIDLGAVGSGEATVEIRFRGEWVPNALGVDARLVSLHLVGQSRQVTLPLPPRLGALEFVGKDLYRVLLTLELPADLPPGHYTGSIVLSNPHAVVQPAEYTVTFYRPPGILGAARQFLLPAWCLAYDWFWPFPFLRWKGLLGWGLLTLLLILIWPDRSGMVVISEFDQTRSRATATRPVYVVLGGDGVPRLASRAGAADVLAEVTFEAPEGEEEHVLLRPRANLEQAQVGYNDPRFGNWCLVPESGVSLQASERFVVLVNGILYTFTLELS